MKEKHLISKAFESMDDMDRRSFLRLSGLLGLSLAAFGVIPAAAEAVKFDKDAYKISRTKLAMGTAVSMTLIHPSRDKAEEAMSCAYKEIDRLTRLMSRFDGTTAVGRLNSEGLLKDVPPEVTAVVARALDYYRLSRGAFDITVKPLVDLFKKNFSGGKIMLPVRKDLEQAISLVGSDKIVMDHHSIRFQRQGVGITLDGIAKGYIVDRAYSILASHKIENYLINAGGDIRTKGSGKSDKPWNVAIQDPRKGKQYPDVIPLTDGAIATSGNYEVYFDNEKMFHHIVDPKTGMSPGKSTSVSVLAETAMDADALSTSVFVMAPVVGIRFINSIPESECLVMSREGRIFRSKNWKKAAAQAT